MLWKDLQVLVTDTGRVWWRRLPEIVAIYLVGWTGSQLVLRLSVIAGDLSAWLTLILFAFHFVILLSATVLILQVVGRQLGIRELLPPEERTDDRRDAGVSQLLLVTLLPFLGMYAAFGQVSAAANQLVTEQLVRYGIFSDRQTVLGVLNDAATNHLPWLLALIIGCYLLRRLLDYLHDRTGLAVLGLAVVLVESFFLLLVIMGGVRVFQVFGIWLRDRRFLQWFAVVKDELSEFLARFAIDLPAILAALGRFLIERLWPVFWEVLSQPILWLAVAALIYGSQVLSLAELWRKGQPYARRVPGATAFARYRDRRALRRVGPPPRGLLRAATEVQNAFFGDINDKYLPTLHSLRLILRAGVLFLGSFVLAYSMVLMGQHLAETALHLLTGGREVRYWVRYGPVHDVAVGAVFEPLRLCLLAVAFRRCLELFGQRTDAVQSVEAMAAVR